MSLAIAAVIAVVGLQVAALAAAAGRLSAVVRARRLSNLRLLGLTAARTRAVAAVEVGIPAVVGAAGGVGLFVVVRPLLARISIGGRPWPESELRPGVLVTVLVAVASVLLTVGVAALPERFDPKTALARVRGSSSISPTWWRLTPLVLGVGFCLLVQRTGADEIDARVLLLGIVSLGLGVMLVVPIFVRLVALVLGGAARGPVLLVASRRLEAQPAGMNRVVTGLLVGLFVVTGARSVVTAFEATPQYRGAAIGVLDQQMVVAGADAAEVAAMVEAISHVAGVRSVAALPVLEIANCDGSSGPCVTAVVATCDQIQTVYPGAIGCIPDEIQWFRQYERTAPQLVPAAVWVPSDATEPTAPATNPQSPIDISEIEPLFQGHQMRIPPTAPGVAALVTVARRLINVIGDPGRDLADRLRAAGAVDGALSPWDPSEYDFVETLRVLADSVAALVLGLGLIAFAISAIDRATDRRRDITGLLLLGASRSALRRSQWIEAAVPIVGGAVVAVALGLLAGSTYLAGVGELTPPTAAAARLAIAAAIGGFAIAGFTVIAASPSLGTHNIRRE